MTEPNTEDPHGDFHEINIEKALANSRRGRIASFLRTTCWPAVRWLGRKLWNAVRNIETGSKHPHPNSQAAQAQKSTRAVLIAILCLTIVGAVLCRPDYVSDRSPADRGPRYARVGEVTTLRGPGTYAAVAATKANLTRLFELSAAKDTTGIEQMVLSGRVWMVPNGTQVRVIRLSFSGYEVRIEEGAYAGQSGWVAKTSSPKWAHRLTHH